MFATRNFTARIPSPWHESRKFFKYWANAYRPLKKQIIVNALLQSIAVLYVFRMAETQFKIVEQSLTVPDVDGENESHN